MHIVGAAFSWADPRGDLQEVDDTMRVGPRAVLLATANERDGKL